MELDWHDSKSETCRRERGFGFEFAVRIFAGPVIEHIDDRRDYGELRVRALGDIDGLPYVVVYTDRLDDDGPVRWIISARRAHEKERLRWREES